MSHKGACFSLVRKASPAKALRPLRVLVVDDDRDTVLSLLMLMREEGHEVRGAHTGRHVMAAVLDFDPDVVILDINLPDCSGWEVSRTIREHRGRERPEIIGISGEYKKSPDRILAQIVGFDHYLVKPYAPANLVKLVASVQPK